MPSSHNRQVTPGPGGGGPGLFDVDRGRPVVIPEPMTQAEWLEQRAEAEQQLDDAIRAERIDDYTPAGEL